MNTTIPLPKPTENETQLREIFEELGGFGVNPLTPADVDVLAEQYSEGRTFPQRHVNFLE